MNVYHGHEPLRAAGDVRGGKLCSVIRLSYRQPLHLLSLYFVCMFLSLETAKSTWPRSPSRFSGCCSLLIQVGERFGFTCSCVYSSCVQSCQLRRRRVVLCLCPICPFLTGLEAHPRNMGGKVLLPLTTVHCTTRRLSQRCQQERLLKQVRLATPQKSLRGTQ